LTLTGGREYKRTEWKKGGGGMAWIERAAYARHSQLLAELEVPD
jgi:hypothetical protein